MKVFEISTQMFCLLMTDWQMFLLKCFFLQQIEKNCAFFRRIKEFSDDFKGFFTCNSQANFIIFTFQRSANFSLATDWIDEFSIFSIDPGFCHVLGTTDGQIVIFTFYRLAKLQILSVTDRRISYFFPDIPLTNFAFCFLMSDGGILRNYSLFQ